MMGFWLPDQIVYIASLHMCVQIAVKMELVIL